MRQINTNMFRIKVNRAKLVPRTLIEILPISCSIFDTVHFNPNPGNTSKSSH